MAMVRNKTVACLTSVAAKPFITDWSTVIGHWFATLVCIFLYVVL